MNPKAYWLLLLAVALWATAGVGCGNKQPPARQVAGPAVAPAADSPGSTKPPPPMNSSSSLTVAANPDGGANLKQLNHAFVKWIATNHRRPASFEEFVAASGLQIPAPPAGKKYVIDQNGLINITAQ